MDPATIEEIVALLTRLPGPQQEQALAYVRALEQSATTRLAVFAGTIRADDLAAIGAAIDADCKQVDAG
jgi:hypothetical protein